MKKLNRENYISLINFIVEMYNFLTINIEDDIYLINIKGQDIALEIYSETLNYVKKYYIKLLMGKDEEIYLIDCFTPEEKLIDFDNKINNQTIIVNNFDDYYFTKDDVNKLIKFFK